jgi:hypothetical protein
MKPSNNFKIAYDFYSEGQVNEYSTQRMVLS